MSGSAEQKPPRAADSGRSAQCPEGPHVGPLAPDMRVGLVIESLTGGGAEVIVRGLAAGLARRGHQVFVYCLKDAGAHPDELAAAGVVVREAHSGGCDPLLAARLLHWFRQDRIELVNSHNSAATVWSLPGSKALRIPLVQTRHGGLLGRPTRYARLANMAGPLLEGASIVAEPLRERLPRSLARRAVCIPNGIDLDPVAPALARAALERYCGRALTGPVVLSVGTICPEKDVCNLLRAFALLRKQLLAATLVYVGAPRGPAYERLVKAQARRLGLEEQVIFGGNAAEPWRMMAGADVFCLSSITEAMPLVVIEAMSQRIPIVATAVGAVGRIDPQDTDSAAPDCLLVHGQSALLAAPGRPRALAQALSEALHDRRAAARRAAAALADYERCFRSDVMVCGYERLYSSLARRRINVGRRATIRDARPRVLMVGPGPHEVGGITSVMNELMAGPLGERFTLHRYWRRAADVRKPRRRVWPLQWVRSALRHLAALNELAGVIRHTRAEIVHIHTPSFFSFYRSLLDAAVGKALGRRVCLHIHGGRFDQFCEQSGLLGRWLIRHRCELADAVVVLSPYWKRHLARYLGRSRVCIIPNGVAVGKQQAQGVQNANDRCRFVFLGELCVRKGVPELLAAAAQVRAAGVSFELVLAGPADSSGERWQEAAARLGLDDCIKFIGPVLGTAKAELLASADCLVLPSRQDALPMVLLEAGAAGVSVIASAVGSIPDLLGPSGDESRFVADDAPTAPLIAPGDVPRLAREMIRLARSPELRQRIGRDLYERISRDYSVERMSERVAAVYRGLLYQAWPETEPAESSSRRPSGFIADKLPDEQTVYVRSRFRALRIAAPALEVETK